jgi:hypothetical protein
VSKGWNEGKIRHARVPERRSQGDKGGLNENV